MIILDTLLVGGIKFVLRKIVDAVEAQLNDDSVLHEELLAAQMRLELGEITDVFRVGESEVYIVHGPRGEILVPAVESIVKELSPAANRVVVDAEALGLTDAAED